MPFSVFLRFFAQFFSAKFFSFVKSFSKFSKGLKVFVLSFTFHEFSTVNGRVVDLTKESINAEPEWYMLVPQYDPLDGGATIIPALLKDHFASYGIRWTVSRGPYPAGFSAPALPKFKAIMLNWPKEARVLIMDGPIREAKLRLNEAIEKFAGDIKYHEASTQEEEVLSALHFLALLHEHFAPGRKLVARSWLDEVLDKNREKRPGRFKINAPRTCGTLGCKGRYTVTDRIGNIVTLTCPICHDSVRVKVKRKLAGKVIPEHGEGIKQTCIHHFSKMDNRCCAAHTEECRFCYKKR